jgi:hypothetical protein
MYGSLNAVCKSRIGVRLGKFPMVRRILFSRRCNRWLSAANSHAGQAKTNLLLSFDMTWTTQKTTTPPILCCHGTVFIKLLPSNDMGIHRQTLRHPSPTIILLLRVFVDAGTCLPSRCLESIGGIQFPQPFPSNDKRDTNTDTQTDGRKL